MPALRRVGVTADALAVKAFNRADANGDGKLSLAEFDKLYRYFGGFDAASPFGAGPAGAAGGYAPAGGGGFGGGVRSSGALTASAGGAAAVAVASEAAKTAVLFAKRVAIDQLEPERPYAFWVDARANRTRTQRPGPSACGAPPNALHGACAHRSTRTAGSRSWRSGCTPTPRSATACT